ncbi:MAG: ABC transporter ATP-binding protein, partial [Planctomycetota bacterium]
MSLNLTSMTEGIVLHAPLDTGSGSSTGWTSDASGGTTAALPGTEDRLRPPDPNREQPVVRVADAKKVYYKPDGSVLVEALRGVTVEVYRGEYVAIMGASGSGKSTLMNLLGCLDRPTTGGYFLDGRDVAEMDDQHLSKVRGQRIGFVFQAFNLISALTVFENVQVPLFYQGVPRAVRQT